MTHEQSTDPKALRRSVFAAIQAVSPETRALWNEALSWQLIEQELTLLHKPSRLALYRSLPSEPDPSEFADAALQAGHLLYFPRVEGDHLEFVRVENPRTHPWKKGSFGMEEPVGADAILASELDWILVPGVAFTPSGHRLGRGKGFYDRLLSKLSPSARTVAIAYPPSRFQALPQHEGDQPVSHVIFP